MNLSNYQWHEFGGIKFNKAAIREILTMTEMQNGHTLFEIIFPLYPSVILTSSLSVFNLAIGPSISQKIILFT